MAKGRIVSYVYKGCRKIQQNTDGQICVFSSHSDLRFCGSVVYLTLTAKDSCNQNVIWFRRDSDNTLRIESAFVFFPVRGRENKALFESCARRSGLDNLVFSRKFCFMSSRFTLTDKSLKLIFSRGSRRESSEEDIYVYKVVYMCKRGKRKKTWNNPQQKSNWDHIM